VEPYPFTADGEVPDDFERHPDWTVEILSKAKPNQVVATFFVYATDVD